jgi:hypothetical protein
VEGQRRAEDAAAPALGALAREENRARAARDEQAKTLAEAITIEAAAPRDRAAAGAAGPPPPPAGGAAAPPPAAARPAPAPAAAAPPRPVAPDTVTGAAAPAVPLERADSVREATLAAARKPEMSALVEIASPVAATRWRVVGGRRLERTTTNGARWDAVALPDPLDLTAGAAPSPTVCWIVGRAGRVYLSTDGERFVRVGFPEAADLVAIRAVDRRSATVTAADGRTFATSDGGASWTIVR